MSTIKPHRTMLTLLERVGRADMTLYTIDPTRYVFLLGLREGRFVRGWVVELAPGHAFDGKLKTVEGLVKLVLDDPDSPDTKLPLPPHLRVELDEAALQALVGVRIGFGGTGVLKASKIAIRDGK